MRPKVHRGVLAFTWLLVSLPILLAQAPPVAQPPAAAIPPDRRAYLDAMSITDPDRKLEALEKFVADYPTSGGVAAGHQSAFDTLVKNRPEQKERILTEAEKFLDAVPEAARASAYATVANTLVDAGILLDKAEELAGRGLTIADEEGARLARQRRAGPLSTLGRIYLKQGKLAEAEAKLKEAFASDPGVAGAAVALAEMAEKAGNQSAALDYWLSAALSGRMKAAERQLLEASYRRGHSGSLDGLNEMLDTKYRRDFPNPIKVLPYSRDSSRSQRLVLAEVFTGSGCPPCAATSLAIDAALQRYDRRDLVLLMYHTNIPVPDPMTNPATLAYAKYYAVTAAPTIAIDGVRGAPGGGTREAARMFYDRLVQQLEPRFRAPSEADIALDATGDGSAVKVRVALSNVKSTATKLRLQIALVEDELKFSGENGTRLHPMVVRSLAGPNGGGFEVDLSMPPTEWSFDLKTISAAIKKYLDDFENGRAATDKYKFVEKKDAIDPRNLSVVAFVQDEQTKRVLQSVYVKVKP